MTSAVSKKDGKSSEILKSSKFSRKCIAVSGLYMFVTCLCVCAGCTGSESLSLSIRLRPKASKAVGREQEVSGPPQDVAVSKTPF